MSRKKTGPRIAWARGGAKTYKLIYNVIIYIAGAGGRLELRPPVLSDLDVKVLPLHRCGTLLTWNPG